MAFIATGNYLIAAVKTQAGRNSFIATCLKLTEPWPGGGGQWAEKLGMEVGVINCLVAVVVTESVSIVLLWLLELGVTRHGL